MDNLLKTISEKLESPDSELDAMILLTGKGLANWYAGQELTLLDIKPSIISLMVDIESVD
jgi:hypothetical protein